MFQITIYMHAYVRVCNGLCMQNYSYHAPLFVTGEQFSLCRTVENFALIVTRIAERKTDKLLRAIATLCLRGTRGSKIRNRPGNQIVRRDNDDAGRRARRHRSGRLLIINRILGCCEWYGSRQFFIAWPRFRQSQFPNPLMSFYLTHFVLLWSNKSQDIWIILYAYIIVIS